MKKIILMGLLVIVMIISCKAKAQEIKPSGAVMVLDNGNVYLANNNINNTVFLGNTRYWEIYEYNDSSRISSMNVYGGFDPTYDYQRIEFNFAMDVIVNGDTNDIDVNDFRVYIPDNVYNECGITWRYNYERLTNVTTAIYNVECVAVQPIRYIEIVFEKNSTNYQNKKFFMTDIEVLPSTEEQTKELVDEIHRLQEIQNQWLENAFTGDYDTTPPSDTYYDYVINKENQIMNEIENVNNVMTTNEIDLNSHTWVWDKITTILSTRSYIMGLYVTALTLGVIKLVMNR